MSGWQSLLWVGVGIGAVGGLFLLDRFCLYLERRGLLFYRHKKPTSSVASNFVAMQQFVDPGVRHVIELQQEEKVFQAESGAPEDPKHPTE